MTRKLSRQRLTNLAEAIYQRDGEVAIAKARAELIERARANAPYSYAELKAAHAEGKLGAKLSTITQRHEMREQVIRFLVERWEVCEGKSEVIRE